jgi:hypothetical protein
MSLKYDAAREAFGSGTLSWPKDTIVAQLVTRAYVADAKHGDARSLKGLAGAAVVLSAKSIPAGWAKCANLVFAQVPAGEEVVAIVIRREAKEENRKTLVAYLDDVPKFPMKPNGGDILVDVPAQGLFRI